MSGNQQHPDMHEVFILAPSTPFKDIEDPPTPGRQPAIAPKSRSGAYVNQASATKSAQRELEKLRY